MSSRTEYIEPGLGIDFKRDGKPIGIEILAPAKLTLAVFNRVLRGLGLPPLKRADLAPLKAAWPSKSKKSDIELEHWETM